MARTKNLRAQKDAIIQLYNKVTTNGFYSHEVKDIFNPQRIHMLSCSGLIIPTGEYITNHPSKNGRRYNQWQFSDKGVEFVQSFD